MHAFHPTVQWFSIWLLLSLQLVTFSVLATNVINDEEAGASAVCKDNNDANDDGSCDDDENDWWNDANMKLIDMWNVLKCDEIFEDDRPVHSVSTWMMLRGAYVGTVGPDDVAMDAFDRKQMFGSGFPPESIEVKVTENKGRSVHATKSFKKGDVIWTDLYTACFDDGMAYRQFLASIPADLACDVLEWAYASIELGVCVDLDEGSLVNHSSSKEKNRLAWEDGNEKPNVAYSDDVRSTGYHIASRDINPGDELLIDYATFAEDSWDLFGLGTWKGIDGDDDSHTRDKEE